MRNRAALATLLLAACIFSGCVHISKSDRMFLREIDALGLPEAEPVKHPAVAGGLNLLPGFGNFYLAIGTEYQDQWLYGFLNLLLWVPSVVWAVPEGVIDANSINKLETVYYYRIDPLGKKEYLRAKAKLEDGE